MSSYALAPLSRVYGAVVRARMALYRSGRIKTHRAAAPVISVGNITTGGTGKTPLVEWVARAAAEGGRRVCVLTRGYGREDVRVRVVVSDGERVLADAREGGDEPRLLAESLLGTAAVVSDRDRVAAARWASEHLKTEAFVLDDGFQHLRLARELDIVTVDATAPWGGGRLLPRGRLREPLEGLARAGCVVITRADLAGDLAALRAEVERLSGAGGAVVTSRVKTVRVSPLAPSSPPFEFEGGAGGQPVAAFCAVGNPWAFFKHLRKDGYQLSHTRVFADHHVFTQRDAEAVAREAGQSGARLLLTTAKDAVKLRPLEFALPVYVVEIGVEFDEEETLRGLVREAINRADRERG